MRKWLVFITLGMMVRALMLGLESIDFDTAEKGRFASVDFSKGIENSKGAKPSFYSQEMQAPAIVLPSISGARLPVHTRRNANSSTSTSNVQQAVSYTARQSFGGASSAPELAVVNSSTANNNNAIQTNVGSSATFSSSLAANNLHSDKRQVDENFVPMVDGGLLDIIDDGGGMQRDPPPGNPTDPPIVVGEGEWFLLFSLILYLVFKNRKLIDTSRIYILYKAVIKKLRRIKMPYPNLAKIEIGQFFVKKSSKTSPLQTLRN